VSEVNLLDRYPRSKRPIEQREVAVARERDVAKQFGHEYFDGERTQGYGGYHYDGRWVPIAERFRDYYGLKRGHRVLDVGCAKGFLLHDLLTVVPGLEVYGVDVSAYALEHAMDDVRRYCLRATADGLPFGTDAFDLVISINTIHNLPLDRCKAALAEMERVSRTHKYLQVDSWLTEEQHANFERWQLTAVTYFDPAGWRKIFDEVAYTGDYYWTMTE
jgi:SAM-dependent methyltransferase